MNKWIAEFDLEDGDTMPEHMDLEYKGAKIDFHCKPLEQEPKTGHWIADVDKWGDVVTTVNGYRCDKCNAFNSDKDNYCPNCGAKMAEIEG